MRFAIRPIQNPLREIDVTHRLTAAIAEELWRLYGGNEQLNWAEAERHLQCLVESVRGQVNDEAIEKASAEALDEARWESDAPPARERLFVVVTRMDGDGDADSVPEPRRVMERNGELGGQSPGVRTKPRRGAEAGGERGRKVAARAGSERGGFDPAGGERGRKVAARESRHEERVGAA